MNVFWSPHADSLLGEIVVGIAEALSVDDALRWEADFRDTAERIGDFPFSGAKVPEGLLCHKSRRSRTA